MKKTLFFVAFLIGASIATQAQNLITVQHAGAPTFYTKLTDAITAAMAGDTVYVPGGNFEAISINKKLSIIGVGDNPDSTSVTSRAVIQQIALTTGADNGSITGIYFPQIINYDSITISGNIANYTITRCNIYDMEQTDSGILSNFLIAENIFNRLIINGSNNFITNNIITNAFGITNGIVKNNILTAAGIVISAETTTFENNIVEFLQTPDNSYLETNNCVFHNNINIGINGASVNASNNQGSNNYLTFTDLSSIFSGYNSSTITGDGIYKQDFTLPANSPYKNAGTDGTDIGIYGGAFPWKPGSVPINPHFQAIKVAPKTDSSGNLKVQITVAAQNN